LVGTITGFAGTVVLISADAAPVVEGAFRRRVRDHAVICPAGGPELPTRRRMLPEPSERGPG